MPLISDAGMAGNTRNIHIKQRKTGNGPIKNKQQKGRTNGSQISYFIPWA